MVTYGTFKGWLYAASNGEHTARSWANSQLMKFRAEHPEQFQEYFSRAKQETKDKNIAKF